MKPIGYLLAGAAVLAGLTNAGYLIPDDQLPNGWRYKGCYSLVTASTKYNYKLTFHSEKPKGDIGSGEPAGNPYGPGTEFKGNVSTNVPRMMNDYMFQWDPNSFNGANRCLPMCGFFGYKYAGLVNNDCCMSARFIFIFAFSCCNSQRV
jgi:hypothetical protein